MLVFFFLLSVTLHVSIQFNFADYIRRAYLLGDVILTDSDTVILSNIQYLRNVSSIIDQYSPRTIQNYVVCRFLMQLVDDMPRQFREIKRRFIKVVEGGSTEKLRKSTCATYVSSAMGFAVSKLYIKKYFDANARNQVSVIINSILIVLFHSLKVIANG